MRALLVAVLVLIVAAPAAGQQVEIQRKPTERELRPEVIPPGLHYEQTRPSDANYYPYDQRVMHDPAFIEPFSMEYQIDKSTGRLGLSGWTSPNTPLGSPVASGHRDVTGWLSFGFSIIWGGPPPTITPASAPVPRGR
ncbi:MAG: hypothetical protein DMD81_00870 [Candidatus Rokuibacteriota bacterium]|nr:MAG: hypothetical protein DMD81_00870 [Candidatus Rokubacteria bacterium]